MFLLRSSCYVLLGALIFSCQKREKNTAKTFYNLDSLLKAQAYYLAEDKTRLLKEALMDDQTDTVTLKNLDTTEWLKELEVFRQLDLNKKSFSDKNYSIQQGINDPQSNLLICEYKAKDKFPIRLVKIYYQDKLNKPIKIEGEFYEHNGLYSNARNMMMELKSMGSVTVLTNYSITGGQKMIMRDSVQFRINGTLIH